MRYVRISLNDKEYIKVKKYADTDNKTMSKYLKSIALRQKKEIHLYSLLHNINILLEKILTEVKNSNYSENDNIIYSYLFTIENHLNELIYDNNSQ